MKVRNTETQKSMSDLFIRTHRSVCITLWKTISNVALLGLFLYGAAWMDNFVCTHLDACSRHTKTIICCQNCVHLFGPSSYKIYLILLIIIDKCVVTTLQIQFSILCILYYWDHISSYVHVYKRGLLHWRDTQGKKNTFLQRNQVDSSQFINNNNLKKS